MLEPSQIEALRPYGIAAAVVAVALLVGWLAAWTLLSTLRGWARHREPALEPLVVQHVRRPLYLLGPVVAFLVASPALPLPAEALAIVRQVASIVGVIAATRVVIGAIEIGEQWLLTRHLGTETALARSMQTRVRMGRNLAVVFVAVLGVAIALTTIEPVRELGTSLLASAGVAGVVVGFAAQRSLSTLLAGVQIAITEPIRIDDIVVVEKESGRIEEITLTYVVMRLWDQRRLVVPITWFLEKPFENWTRSETALLGTVELKVDVMMPLVDVRARLDAILDAVPDLWDGRQKVVQVTDMNEQVITIRLVVSASDAGKLWDLRCRVREEMLEWLKSRPEAIGRVRVVSIGTEPVIYPG